MKTKRFLIILICVLSILCVLLTACLAIVINKSISETEFEYIGVVDKKEAIHIDMSDDYIQNSAWELEMNEELAYKIGYAVIESTFPKVWVENKKCMVREQNDENIYIVSLYHEDDLDGGLFVAIDKTNGKIIKIGVDW